MRQPASTSDAPVPLEQEPREASGLTTGLILRYVEREGGRDAVEELLERCDLVGRERELLDEDRWFADARRVEMFVAAADVLGDPLVAKRIGEAAIEFNIGQGLKLALRGLGSPRMVYSNIVRANAKFNAAHKMTMLEVGEGRAKLRNVPLEGVPYHPCDCEYNVGILSTVPRIFGYPQARVGHPICIGRGAEECIYEIEWTEARSPLPLSVTGLTLLAATAWLAPSLLPLAAAAAALLALVAGRRAIAARARRVRNLEALVEEKEAAAERMMSSLKDVVSALELDEVLAKVTDNASAAVGGAQFALLVREEGSLRCRSSSGLPERSVEVIERWANGSGVSLDAAFTIENLGRDPRFDDLSDSGDGRFGALCAVPLLFHGEQIGMLIALATNAAGFLPRDITQLESYGTQAAIALANATRFETQQELAIKDPLTELYNHRHFHETLERELDRCRRHGGDLGVVLLDLNRFKQINDRHGHAEGDEVLRRVARGLERSCRMSDLAFRIGGDEFALVLPGAGEEAARTAAERAQRAISESDRRASITWGVASWPDAGPTKDALLARADAALYAAKAIEEGAPIATAKRDESGTELRERRRLASTSRLAVKLAPQAEVGAIARIAADELARNFPLRLARVMRIQSPEGTLATVAAAGPLLDGLPELAELEQPAGEGICALAARSGDAQLTDDADAEDGVAPLDSGSQLAAPIHVQGRRWGVLHLVRAERAAFDFEDVLFADTCAAAIGSAIHRGELFSELESAFLRTLAVLGDAMEAKDAYTAAHAREVSELAVRVGERLGMDAGSLRTLSYGALLHDIGKIGIRSEILSKPGTLTDEEYEEVKAHTVVGAQMLERIPYFAEVHPLVRTSHERWDGAGYPDGLRGAEIPLGARIISACDALHAMISDRPYRPAMPMEEALEELSANAGSQFDAEVVEALLEVADEGTGADDPEPPSERELGRAPA